DVSAAKAKPLLARPWIAARVRWAEESGRDHAGLTGGPGLINHEAPSVAEGGCILRIWCGPFSRTCRDRIPLARECRESTRDWPHFSTGVRPCKREHRKLLRISLGPSILGGSRLDWVGDALRSWGR